MHSKALIALVLPILAVHALPAKRDDIDDALSLITGADTNTADAAELSSILDSGSSGTATVSGAPTLITPDAAQSASLAASILLAIAHAEINQLPPASRSQFTAFVTTVAGAPVVEIASNGGAPLTLATETAGAVPTVFAGHSILVIPPSSPPSSPPKKNSASELSVSKPLLTGMLGALGAVAAGAMMLL